MPTSMQLKAVIKKIPLLGTLAQKLWALLYTPKNFPGSGTYWEERYKAGGNSGIGSYNRLAVFKADVINAFVAKHGISSVIEYGCGDGNQLKLGAYPRYLGFDVSPAAVELCRKTFAGDASKSFKRVDEYANETADLAMSLDVIYHLVEDAVYEPYMHRLFASAQRFVIVYSSDDESLNPKYGGYHVKHRQFTAWVRQHAPEWELIETIPNKYPYRDSDPDTSLADFYFYRKRST